MKNKIVMIEFISEVGDPYLDTHELAEKISLFKNGTVIIEEECKVKYKIDLIEIEWAMNELIELATNENSKTFVTYDHTRRTMIFFDELNNQTIYCGNFENEDKKQDSIEVIEAIVGRCKTRYKGEVI